MIKVLEGQDLKSGGFVKLWRNLLEIPLSPNAFAVYGYLLLSASYKNGAVAYNTTLSAGQVIIKNKTLEEHYNLSPREIRTALDKLTLKGLITRKSTNKFTVITVCNYGDFDEPDIGERQTKDKQETNERQTKDKHKEKEGIERLEREESISAISGEKADAKKALEGEFEEFWGQYPNKVKKKDALKKFTVVRKATSFEAIMEGVKRYHSYIASNSWYSPAHAVTWLNQKRWEDGEAVSTATATTGMTLEELRIEKDACGGWEGFFDKYPNYKPQGEWIADLKHQWMRKRGMV